MSVFINISYNSNFSGVSYGYTAIYSCIRLSSERGIKAVVFLLDGIAD